MFPRQIHPVKTKSFFLFGPRQTGKSTYVQSLLTPQDLYIDLLPQRNYLGYAKNPGSVREEILAHLERYPEGKCVIDEIQKIPSLLDEVHELIESRGTMFILTGSSARKLRRGAANLLAGRAYTYRLFPLTFEELGDRFNLDRALRIGTLPVLWGNREEDPAEFLRSYTETYLKEEVAAEGLVRDIGPFAQFLDIAAASDGETVNANNIARECSVSAKTVQQYYQILEDTFVAVKLPAWTRSARRRLVSNPRYYLFDPGVANALCHTLSERINPNLLGRRFEQFVIGQLTAAIHYHRLDYTLHYWRTNHGAEVDVLLCTGDRITCALEIKSSRHIASESLTGLKSFLQDNPGVPAYVLGIKQRRRKLAEGLTVIDWQDFIQEFAGGKLVPAGS
ncbi:MAG: ATP-binding protein [Deltaproteobacteria bacterium]|nr:ATP-binding protein [Deltaproteobacteria bacterium]